MLRALRDEVTRTLGSALVGMYLAGSLALGDFTAGSDVDVVVATDGELADETLAALGTMHDRLAASGMRWCDQLEVVYVPVVALRRYDPAHATHPYLGRGQGEHLQIVTFLPDGVMQRVALRERGIVLAGPPPTELIDPIAPDELRASQRALMRSWWGPMAEDGPAAAFLRQSGHQSLAVLTMCRVRYTLRMGTIASKSAAAAWAQAALDHRWRGLIERAAAWRADHAPDDSVLAAEEEIRATQELIRSVAAECEAWPGAR
jgi:hypothetical protein